MIHKIFACVIFIFHVNLSEPFLPFYDEHVVEGLSGFSGLLKTCLTVVHGVVSMTNKKRKTIIPHIKQHVTL